MATKAQRCERVAILDVDETGALIIRPEVRIKFPAILDRLTDKRSGSHGITIPSNASAYEGQDSLLGITFKLGWDQDEMRARLPCHLALSSIAGSIVWLAVLLWATETNDSNTALAFGSLLVGFFTLLLGSLPSSDK